MAVNTARHGSTQCQVASACCCSSCHKGTCWPQQRSAAVLFMSFMFSDTSRGSSCVCWLVSCCQPLCLCGCTLSRAYAGEHRPAWPQSASVSAAQQQGVCHATPGPGCVAHSQQSCLVMGCKLSQARDHHVHHCGQLHVRTQYGWLLLLFTDCCPHSCQALMTTSACNLSE